MDRLCHSLEQKCNSHSCDVCGKLYCMDCDRIGWYCDKCEKNVCESCENIRKCSVCKNELCNFCEEICECETYISRTSSRDHLVFYSDNKTKLICDKECFDDLIRCDDCEEVYCMGHDFTGYCSRCDKVIVLIVETLIIVVMVKNVKIYHYVKIVMLILQCLYVIMIVVQNIVQIVNMLWFVSYVERGNVKIVLLMIK